MSFAHKTRKSYDIIHVLSLFFHYLANILEWIYQAASSINYVTRAWFIERYLQKQIA